MVVIASPQNLALYMCLDSKLAKVSRDCRCCVEGGETPGISPSSYGRSLGLMSNVLISEIQKDTLLIFSLIPQKCYHAQEYELFACHTKWHVVQFILSCVNILFICVSECLETY